MLAVITRFLVGLRKFSRWLRTSMDAAGEPDTHSLYNECLVAEHKHRSTGMGVTINLCREATRVAKNMVPVWFLLTVSRGGILRNQVVVLDIPSRAYRNDGQDRDVSISRALLEHVNYWTRIHHGDYTIVSWMEIPPQAQKTAEELDVAICAGSGFRMRMRERHGLDRG